MKISVIIPTLNEEGNIKSLVKRLDKAFTRANMTYELIFIDDHSKDNTQHLLATLQDSYPIKFHVKKGEKGKAFSLLEGFSHARYELLAILDADLQYPPEEIPSMVQQIEEGKADIVVARRKEQQISLARRLTSKIFATFFGKILHNLDCDVQSGMKVFRKEIIERFSIHPSPWTFDLEFLLKSRQAGYTIGSHDIQFHERKYGASKVSLLKSSWEIGISAIKLKFAMTEPIFFSKEMIKREGKGFHYNTVKFVPHNALDHKESALIRITPKQGIVLCTLTALFLVGLILNWHEALVITIDAVIILYFIDILFNFFLVYQSYLKSPEFQVSKEQLEKYPESHWPMYSIFCPLYKESEILPQFIDAMSKLDYPKNKLQIMLLLEEDDTETIEKVRTYPNLPSNVELFVVPHSLPKTKPKALNFGLQHAKGEYAVIYDAEDIPDPFQLKKAVIAFETLGEKTICVQAKLNYYNPTQNVLTRLFTAEYSVWFELILPGLQSMHAPIPLGGTSNHFRIDHLRTLQGWDPFNVTEDADLGMRIAKKGYLTAIIDSTTMEEANSQYKNWIKQRSRWIKGYMQTYLVHIRKYREFFKNTKHIHFVIFQIMIGGKVIAMLINPLMWLMTLAYFALNPVVGPFIESLFPTAIFYTAIFSLAIGNFLYMYAYMIGIAKRDQWELIPFTLLTPIYWLMMSIAACMAAWELIVKPHYWHKTKHGLHIKQQTHTLLQETITNTKIAVMVQNENAL